MSEYEKPGRRAGHVLCFVQWDAAGRVRRTKYALPGATDAPVPPQPVAAPSARRSIIAIEQGSLL